MFLVQLFASPSFHLRLHPSETEHLENIVLKMDRKKFSYKNLYLRTEQ